MPQDIIYLLPRKIEREGLLQDRVGLVRPHRVKQNGPKASGGNLDADSYQPGEPNSRPPLQGEAECGHQGHGGKTQTDCHERPHLWQHPSDGASQEHHQGELHQAWHFPQPLLAQEVGQNRGVNLSPIEAGLPIKKRTAKRIGVCPPEADSSPESSPYDPLVCHTNHRPVGASGV